MVKSLRPLLRRRPSRLFAELDEVATVDRIIDERFQDLVFRAAPERWLQLTLVFDTGASTDLWRPMYRELQSMLEQIGAFSRVRSWHWATDRNPPELHPPLDKRPGARAPHRPLEVIDPSGEQLVLIVTDCVSSAWHNGSAATVLAKWAKFSQVALLQVMPWYMWSRTALRHGTLVTLASRTPVTPNTNLQTNFPRLPFGRTRRTGVGRNRAAASVETTITLPIATLEPSTLNDLARVAAGTGSATVNGFVLSVESTIVANRPSASVHRASRSAPSATDAASSDARANHIVTQFWETASPLARKLARYLAAAPVITLPVVRMLRHTFLSDAARQVHEAEVMLGGLLRAVAHTGSEADPDLVEYEFYDGVRTRLLEAVGVTDIRAVLKQISEVLSRYVEDHLGQAVDFRALLADPTGVARGPLLPPRTRIAGVAAEILRRLGGEYGRMVARLTQSSDDRQRLTGKVATILHLSGLYFGYGSDTVRRKRDRASALDDIRGLIKLLIAQGRKPDAVVITGDVAMDGQSSQFEMATNWINTQLLATLAPFPPNQIIIVPGNHDIDPSGFEPTQRERATTARQAMANQSAITEFWHSRSVSGMLKPLRAFERFSGRYCKIDITSPQTWGVRFTTEDGIHVGVARLCSSIFRRSSRARGVVGEFVAEQALRSLNDVDLCIAVMHDPPGSLKEFDRADLLRVLRSHECDVMLVDHSREFLEPTRIEPHGIAVITAGGLGSRVDKSMCQLVELPADQAVARVSTFIWNAEAGWRQRQPDDEPTVMPLGPMVSSDQPRTAKAEKAEPDWGLKLLGIPELWERGLTGKDITIAHLANRPDSTHPALRGAVKSTQAIESVVRKTRVRSTKNQPGEYGTQLAGIMVGRPSNGTAVGCAPGASLVSFDVLAENNTTDLVAMTAAIEDLVRMLASDPSIRVLCLTLGSRSRSATLVRLANLLRRHKQLLFVAAIGNDGPATSSYPGNQPEVLSVGACGRECEVAAFSSSERFEREVEALVPSLVAPGVDVLTCTLGGTYGRQSGTSMAAGYVAGMAALLFEAMPQATAEQVREAILGSCIRPPAMSAERGNRGVPNGPRALSILQGMSDRDNERDLATGEQLLHLPAQMNEFREALVSAVRDRNQLDRLLAAWSSQQGTREAK